MGQLLATDLQNTEFQGAVSNPNSLLHVEFYMGKPLDQWSTEQESAKAGRYVRVYHKEEPYVRIMRPGDQNSIIEVRVREEHKQNWPEKWLYFQMREGMVEEHDIPGWKIEEWPHLLDKQDLLRDLKYGRFSTVEQVAGASDAQCQKMGMGAQGLREQARVDLRKKVSLDLNDQINAKDKKIEDLTGAMEILREQVAMLMEAQTAPAAAGKKHG